MEQEGGPCWRTAGEIDQIDHTLISSSADFRRSDFLLDMMLLKFSDLHSRISIWIRKEKYTCDQNGVVYFTHLDLPGILNSERKGGKVRCHMPPWLYGQAGPWTRLWCLWLMSGSLERMDRKRMWNIHVGRKLKLQDPEGRVWRRLTLFSGEAIVLEDLGDSHDGTNGCNQKGRIDVSEIRETI